MSFATGNDVHFRLASSRVDVVGRFVLSENSRSLVLVGSEAVSGSVAVKILDSKFAVTWVKTLAVRPGLPLKTSGLLGIALIGTALLQAVLGNEISDFESTAEELAATTVGQDVVVGLVNQLAALASEVKALKNPSRVSFAPPSRTAESWAGTSTGSQPMSSSPGVASQMPGMGGLMANAGLWGAFPPSKGMTDPEGLNSSHSGSSDESDFETLAGVRNSAKGKGVTKSAKTAMPPSASAAGSTSASLSLDDMMRMHFERQLASAQSLDMGTMLQYQMMQELTSKTRNRSARAGSDSEKEGNLDMEHDRTSKGFRGVSAVRKKLRNVPASICKDYRKLAKRIRGISHSKQVWSYKDLSKRFLKTFWQDEGLVAGICRPAADYPTTRRRAPSARSRVRMSTLEDAAPSRHRSRWGGLSNPLSTRAGRTRRAGVGRRGKRACGDSELSQEFEGIVCEGIDICEGRGGGGCTGGSPGSKVVTGSKEEVGRGEEGEGEGRQEGVGSFVQPVDMTIEAFAASLSTVNLSELGHTQCLAAVRSCLKGIPVARLRTWLFSQRSSGLSYASSPRTTLSDGSCKNKIGPYYRCIYVLDR